MRERRIRKTRRLPQILCRSTDNYNDDPESVPRHFQISVNVLEAHKLIWSNPQCATSYVVVVLGRKKQKTTVRKNQEEPCYREYLIFEMFMSIKEIQHSSLWLAVMETKFCATPRMLGETTIDLVSVWAQPNHRIYHKWAQLNLPRNTNIRGPVGFLKVDISIILRGDPQVMPDIVCDGIGDQVLSRTGSEQQSAKYVVTIHAAFGLLGVDQSGNDRRRSEKLPTTYVRVSFSGLMGKTSVQYYTTQPRYNEQISIVEMFPSMSQVVRFEVCSAEVWFNRVLASTELRLGVIAHDGDNGFLPVFGPSLLHMYGSSSTIGCKTEDGPFYKGSLLVSLKTLVPYYQQSLRTVTVEPVMALLPDEIWVQEEFCIYSSIFDMSMLDSHIIRKTAGLAMTIGEVPSLRPANEEFITLQNDFKTHKLHYTGSLEVIKGKPHGCIEFCTEYPVLNLAVRLPDFRFRMYRNNIVQGIIYQLELVLSDIEKRLNNFDYITPNELTDELNMAVEDTAENILKYLDIVDYSGNSAGNEDCVQQSCTELDHRQLAFQKEEIEKIYNQLTKKTGNGSYLNLSNNPIKPGTKDSLIGSRKSLKIFLAELKVIVNQLRNTIHKSPYGWPDLIIWLLNDGSRVAYAKINPSEIIYSVVPEQCGSGCGNIQTVYMKPLICNIHKNISDNCYCIAGKVEILLWMGLFRQRNEFVNCMPPEHHLKHKRLEAYVTSTTMLLECKAYIYRAKLTSTMYNLNNTFVRLNALSNFMDSQPKRMAMMPIWNQVLTVKKLMCTSHERMASNPPYALIEVYDVNLTDNKDLIGRFQIQPIFNTNPEYLPKLQWYEIYKGAHKTGEILMSVQYLPVSEQFVKTILYEQEISFYAHNVHESDVKLVETLPACLIPKTVTYKVDVFWWGLRDVNIARKPLVVLEIDDLHMKSEVISDRKPNNNFNNNRTTHIFESPLNEHYPPDLCVRLYDSSTFGRTLFLATNVIKNPAKYIIDWLPKNERETSLKSASITSSDFCKVGGQMFYIKKSLKGSTFSLANTTTAYFTNKKYKWPGMFRPKHNPEEEITLLPVYSKVNNDITKLYQESSGDWWTRYFQSEKGDEYEEDDEKQTPDLSKIVIYEFELEQQPGFSKFKDWCTSLKLYTGEKSGIPEKDAQLQCGILKAGIALYKWPPPKDVVAVSLNGVELDKGYFDIHPSNDPTKHLVRVYVVRALNLPKDCTGRLNPYVILRCGKREIGDRKSYVSNVMEPIFGKMYEFSCNLPEDYLLTVSLYDFDTTLPDELFGSTNIDLEDRIYTKHRARVGLAPEYVLSGSSKWRDNVKPSVILEELCIKNHIPLPIFPDSFSVIVNGVEYKDSCSECLSEKLYTAVERKENICLSILHNWQTLPICGYHLVPEHVETRSLYHPDKPGLERGKIQLWVDIFPMNANTYIPPPRDIHARRIEEYELRVIVWDVQSLLVGQCCWKTTDLYVRTYIGSPENAQQTDIHYNSISGEGNFNWRMVFNFLYCQAERKLINKEKTPYIEYDEFLLPILHVLVMESKEDEILGALQLNLNSMFRGTKTTQQCSLEMMESGKVVNLFSIGFIRGWWPLKAIDFNTGEEVPGGVIDIEMTLLPQGRAILMPVGVGRNGPSPLPLPNRPQENCQEKANDERLQCTEFIQNRYQEILFFIVIVVVVWLLVYILYLAFPAAQSLIYQFSGGVPAETTTKCNIHDREENLTDYFDDFKGIIVKLSKTRKV